MSLSTVQKLIQFCILCVLCLGVSSTLLAQDSSVIGDLFETFFGSTDSPEPVETNNQELDENVPASDEYELDVTIDTPFGEPVENAAPSNDFKDKKIDILDDYQAAVSMAQLHQRPLLIVFGAEWCSWCRKLEKELTQPEAEPILRQWIVAKVDVDSNPEVAQKMAASALPALRILATDQSMIDRHEGYLPLDELRAWLDQNLSQADPAIQKVLYDSGTVSKDDLPTLIGFLSNRSPDVRRAAVERITKAKSDCAGSVVDILRAGKLSQRLSAVEILTTWRAPIANLDPWQPSSITEQSIAPMIEWLRNQVTEDPTNSTSAPEAITSEQSASIVEAFIASNDASSSAAMSEALRFGDALLPEIRLRLAAKELPDAYRIKLRELLYRLLAGERLRLQNSSQFNLLASLDGQTRRDAAEKLLASANSQDEPLIDELSGDMDVLVREMSIPKLQDIGALQDKARLARLLADKSPSVRTSVLRKLSEHPKESSTETLIQYIQSETDEDLLVYAAKTLGQLGSSNGAEDALIKLVSNSSWRIRAAALDSIAEAIKKNSRFSYNDSAPVVSAAFADAVLKATSDPDAFVSERASIILPTTISPTSAESIATYLFEHPEQLKRFEEAFHEYEREQKLEPLFLVLQKWLKGVDAPRIRCAATVLAKLNPSSMQTQLASLLRSNDLSTQLAAMEASVQSIALYRNSEVGNHQSAKTPILVPWFPVPEELVFGKSKKHATEVNKPSAGDTSPDVPAAAPTDPSLNALDGLFGESQPAEDPPEAVVDDKPNVDSQSLDALSNFFGDEPAPSSDDSAIPEKAPLKNQQDKELEGLPSQWLAQWYAMNGKSDVTWVAETLAALRAMQFEQAESTPIRWQHLSMLAAGDATQNAQVVAELEQRLTSHPKSTEPSIEQILPWISAGDRLKCLMSQPIDWESLADVKKEHLLVSATEIDDPAIADWIFSSLNKPNLLGKEDTPVARRLIMRSLFAFLADHLSPYIYEGSGYGGNAPLPGSARGWSWLRDHFAQAESPELRATLLLCASYIDHATSVKNSIGYVASANQYDVSVKVAALTALSDKNDAAAFIAKAWLGHALPEVRELAADRFLSTPTTYLDHWHESDVRFVYDSQNKLPIFWTEVEPISQETLSQAIASATDDEAKRNFKLLLLANSGQVPLDELQFGDEVKKVLVVGALAKRQVFDDASIEYCEKLSDSIHRENAAMFYMFCKSIEHDRVAKIRKRLRDKFGAEVLDF